MSQAEKSIKVTNATEIIDGTITTETCEQEVTCQTVRPLNSVHIQTLPLEYFGRSQGTQTKESKTMVTKGTQTCITSDLLSKYLSRPMMVTTSSQTDQVDMVSKQDESADISNSGKENESASMTETVLEVSRGTKDSDLELSANVSDGEESHDEESCGEDYIMTSGEESEECPEEER